MHCKVHSEINYNVQIQFYEKIAHKTTEIVET